MYCEHYLEAGLPALPKQTVLITGANGFVGKALCTDFARRGWFVKGAVRSSCELPKGVGSVVVGDVDGDTNWTNALIEVDVVIHLAARVHVLNESLNDPLPEFLKVNVAGTQRLAASAAASGVKRFVYVSSIGVNGLHTEARGAFAETDVPNPHNAYAISKWRAEQVLHRVSEETGMEIAILRPPLVYGAGAPGNFAQMIKALAKSVPLPLASVQNTRSLIYIDNLTDALIRCASHPAAAGQTYLVSDGTDISTPDLLRQIGMAIGSPARLFPCPPALLKLAGKLSGKSAQVARLLGSLQIDSAKIRRELGWTPPFTLQQGLQATAEWYRNSRS